MFDFLREVVPAILSIAVLILVPVAVTALVRLLGKLGLDIEAHHRDALQSALQNAALVAVSKMGKSSSLTGPMKAGVALGPAIDYVQNSVPDALGKFNLSRSRVGELLEPHIATALAVKPQETTNE